MGKDRKERRRTWLDLQQGSNLRRNQVNDVISRFARLAWEGRWHRTVRCAATPERKVVYDTEERARRAGESLALIQGGPIPGVYPHTVGNDRHYHLSSRYPMESED
jgi:hypothetical protein